MIESVDPGGVVTRAIDPASVVGCVVYPATEITEPGVIRHVEGHRFSLGEPDESRSERCGEISRAFRAGGLRAPVATDLRSQIWLKVIGNAVAEPGDGAARGDPRPARASPRRRYGWSGPS